MADGVLPALVRGAVVRVVLGDVGVDAGQRQLLVHGVRDGLHDQLGVREGRLALILQQSEELEVAGGRRREIVKRIEAG